jgi:hypothetical protein
MFGDFLVFGPLFLLLLPKLSAAYLRNRQSDVLEVLKRVETLMSTLYECFLTFYDYLS